MDMYTLLYLKCKTNKDILHSIGNSARCYAAAWMGGEFEGEWIQVHVWLTPFALLQNLTTTKKMTFIEFGKFKSMNCKKSIISECLIFTKNRHLREQVKATTKMEFTRLLTPEFKAWNSKFIVTFCFY